MLYVEDVGIAIRTNKMLEDWLIPGLTTQIPMDPMPNGEYIIWTKTLKRYTMADIP